MATEVPVEPVIAEVRARVLDRLRRRLVRHGGSPALEDPALFDDVVMLLRTAAEHNQAQGLILPELLGDPETWRLETSLRLRTHRPGPLGKAILAMKGRILVPITRWLFEYGRENFDRQQRVNAVLFACVQELAIEVARLRRERERPSA